jgi:predicted nucleotidyltransferase
MNSIEINNYKPELKEKLPETYRLLTAAHLKVHPRVKKITLHGSRGPAGKYRDDSDIDLCLVTDIDIQVLPIEECGALLRKVLQTTLESSKCPVELDLAAVYDNVGCGLRCLAVNDYKQLKCRTEQAGCLGIYKIQKGFDGFVPPIIEVRKMYPYMTIWQR